MHLLWGLCFTLQGGAASRTAGDLPRGKVGQQVAQDSRCPSWPSTLSPCLRPTSLRTPAL